MRSRVVRFLQKHWYRIGVLWLLIVTATVLVALSQAQVALDRQAEGRERAVAVTCAATSAVIDAGRATLLASATIKPRRFERALERLGMPPRSARERRARSSAQNYARFIAQRVSTDTNVPGIVNEDGSLNCPRFQRVARAGPE